MVGSVDHVEINLPVDGSPRARIRVYICTYSTSRAPLPPCPSRPVLLLLFLLLPPFLPAVPTFHRPLDGNSCSALPPSAITPSPSYNPAGCATPFSGKRPSHKFGSSRYKFNPRVGGGVCPDPARRRLRQQDGGRVDGYAGICVDFAE